MHKPACLVLEGVEIALFPFPHFSSVRVFAEGMEKDIFEWLEQTENWDFTETDFYTQYEFSLLEAELPESLRFLVSEHTVEAIADTFKRSFVTNPLQLVGVTAHKLVDGHRMGVHNDFIGADETHRLVVHISPGWRDDNGGYLMFFNSKDPQDVARLVLPLDNTGIGFEISQHSFHAVSTVNNFCRYTLVYTFKYKG